MSPCAGDQDARPDEPVVLLCDRCGNPFRTNTIHTECGACAQHQTDAAERRRI